jgi:DNA-directed RNA polymerase specialized sigma24 family protein
MIESRAQQGLDDFSALYVGHYEQLLRLAVLLVGDLSAAEDILQEAFIRVHRRLVRLRHAPRPTPDAASAEEGACAAISRQEVIRALRRIPARQREAVVLRYWADLPEAEIAELMGVSTGAVKGYISRAMDRLGLLSKAAPPPRLSPASGSAPHVPSPAVVPERTAIVPVGDAAMGGGFSCPDHDLVAYGYLGEKAGTFLVTRTTYRWAGATLMLVSRQQTTVRAPELAGYRAVSCGDLTLAGS